MIHKPPGQHEIKIQIIGIFFEKLCRVDIMLLSVFLIWGTIFLLFNSHHCVWKAKWSCINGMWIKNFGN